MITFAAITISPKLLVSDCTITIAMEKIARIRSLTQQFQGIDCGACGSPSCHALAMDIVNGYATEMNCIFKLNERISALAGEMVSLGASTRFSVGGNREEIGEDNDIFTGKE